MERSPMPGEPDRARLLAGSLIVSVLFGWALGMARSLIYGDSVIYEALFGVFGGLVTGVAIYFGILRRRRYSRSFDPADRVVTGPLDAEPLPFVSRRYRMPFPVWAIATVAVLMSTGLAVAAWLIDEPGSVRAAGWALCAMAWAFLVSVALSYTDVSTDGIVVRTLTGRQRIDWPELAEVRWEREVNRDVLVFRTVDGRAITAAGVGASRTGTGELRMARMRNDIEDAWTAAGHAP
ncbi:PH domain-containing protein [Micromonospora globispora]|nr:PH domain-containing protein [Micromonospora globispora]